MYNNQDCTCFFEIGVCQQETKNLWFCKATNPLWVFPENFDFSEGCGSKSHSDHIGWSYFSVKPTSTPRSFL